VFGFLPDDRGKDQPHPNRMRDAQVFVNRNDKNQLSLYWIVATVPIYMTKEIVHMILIKSLFTCRMHAV